MATPSGTAASKDARQPPEVIDTDGEKTIKLAFRDERLSSKDGFEMPDSHD